MISKLTKVMVGAVAMASLVACQFEPSSVVDDKRSAVGRKDKEAQLNLSHIECLEDGTVQAHFVLLHTSGQPGDLTGTWSGGSFGPLAPYKRSGNVWHYEVILPTGYIDILSAEVDGTSLHNPSEYAGDYQCDGDVEECTLVVPEGSQCIATLGNPGSECGYFGLDPIGKDDGLSGLDFEATMDAYVAIVKSGIGDCAQGESSYNVYVGVDAGDILETPFEQDISHVTYCECPTE